MAKLDWNTVLNFTHCVNCGAKKPEPKGKRMVREAFCPNCDAQLHPGISWRVRTAMSGKWFMRWWRFACQWLRTRKVDL